MRKIDIVRNKAPEDELAMIAALEYPDRVVFVFENNTDTVIEVKIVLYDREYEPHGPFKAVAQKNRIVRITATGIKAQEITSLKLEKEVRSCASYRPEKIATYAKQGNLPAVSCAIAAGADLDAKNKYGWTALMFAAWDGHRDVAQALIAVGADLDAKDNDGKTALMWAARYGHRDVAQALVAAGADLEAKNDDGYTALGIARANDKERVAEYPNTTWPPGNVFFGGALNLKILGKKEIGGDLPATCLKK